MKNKVLNIIDINLKKDDKIVIEYIYKHEKNKKVSVILETLSDYVEASYYTVNFSDDLDITRIKITINHIEPYKIDIKIKQDNEEYNTVILDNKGEKISSLDNPYYIFTLNHKIKLLDNCVVIEEKKLFDKIKYEIKKQMYSIKKYDKFSFIRLLTRKKKKFYLFNDRIMFADDNAEQLFRHINKEHKDMAKNSYFVLDKKSPKIKEIKQFGKVLKYGSLKHKLIYLNSRIVISSHASYFDRVYNPFTEKEMDVVKDLITKKFVFLQHGITFCDVHKILNRPQIIADLFVTTTNKEHEDLLTEKYLYDKEMVICTGLGRFDKLKDASENMILIAPTWRTYLTNVKYGNENKQKFEESDFYKTYKSLLENKVLLNKLEERKFEIYFLLHPAFLQFKKEFEKYCNKNIKIVTTENITYSELFRKCSIFITDYSSTHGDVAFLQKPIIYYQFDKEKFHDSHYDKGYFDFERDGFGDVIYTEKELVDNIIDYMDTDCNIKEKYKTIISNTFKFLDLNNCERTYQEIKKIDQKNELNYRFNNVH